MVDLDGLVSGKGGGSGVTEEILSVTRERTKTTWRNNRLGLPRATDGNKDMVVVLKKADVRASCRFLARALIALYSVLMTVLVTGGRGKTGLILSRLFKEANQPVLICSRSGTAPSPYKAVKFDWFDDKTFENPFKSDSNIDRVYLIVPSVIGQLSTVKPFIDLAISKGVKRFVLLTASQAEIGSPVLMGMVHEYLLNIKVDYSVLRPTWFMRTSEFSNQKDKR